MVVKIYIGDQIRGTHIRFRIFTNYEAYIDSIEEGFDAEHAVFDGCLYKNNILQFNLVNRSQYGKGCDFNNEIFEYRDNVSCKQKDFSLLNVSVS